MKARSRWVTALVAVLAALVLSGQAAAQGPPPFTDEWRDMAFRLAEQYAMFGGLDLDLGRLDGAFLNLTIEETTGALLNLTVQKPFGSVIVFRTVTASTAATGLASVDGSMFTFENSAVAISLHNNPAVGLVHTARLQDITIEYELAAGMSAVVEPGSVYLSGNGLRGRVAAFGEASVAIVGDRVVVSLSAGTSSAFRVLMVDGESVAGAIDQMSISDAFGEDQVAAESFLISLEGAVLSDDIRYLPVSVSSRLLGSGIVEVTVESDLPVGNSIALYLHEGVLDGRHREPLVIELDGAPLQPASSADEALMATASTVHVSAAPDGALIIAHIDSSSTHTLLIRAPNPLPLFPTDLFGSAMLGAAIAFVAVAALLGVRRRKER